MSRCQGRRVAGIVDVTVLSGTCVGVDRVVHEIEDEFVDLK